MCAVLISFSLPFKETSHFVFLLKEENCISVPLGILRVL